MNLQKLFEMQAVLDADIIKRHPVQPGEDRSSKKNLALLVELGECANEFREFKFWSNDQEPRTDYPIADCKSCDSGLLYLDCAERMVDCPHCNGEGKITKNLILEEYVDCLHFALSIWNENPPCSTAEIQAIMMKKLEEVTRNPMYVFIDLFNELSFYDKANSGIIGVLEKLAELAKALNFKWEQIEQAYIDKNKINFERQATGY